MRSKHKKHEEKYTNDQIVEIKDNDKNLRASRLEETHPIQKNRD